MIFGNKSDLYNYSFLEEAIKQCFSYAEQHDLEQYENKTYELSGKQLFVNIVEYETTSVENRFWEAHKKYLDLHFMLRGKEQIDLNFIQNMKQLEFVEQDDFLPLEGEANSHIILQKGDFLLCYPQDGHRTAIMVENPIKIKKAIFKIML